MKRILRVIWSIILAFGMLSLSSCASPGRVVRPKVKPPEGDQFKEEQSNEGQPKEEQPKEEQPKNLQVKYKSTPPKEVILDVPVVRQNPELKDGCEVSSLAMLLQYAGIKVDKMALASKVKKDKTPLKQDGRGDILMWGNPHEGFVGDITGKKKGFAVYHKPLLELLEQYLPGRGIDLTGHSFDEVLESVARERPVVLWATIDFKLPHSYEKWRHDGEVIKVTFDEHAVLLVGYDEEYCYVNNPYSGEKKQKVEKSALIKCWKAIGSQAITYQ